MGTNLTDAAGVDQLSPSAISKSLDSQGRRMWAEDGEEQRREQGLKNRNTVGFQNQNNTGF
jgi:hypothetical protein